MSKEDKKKGGGGKVASDPRFAAVHYDPRFQRFPKKKNKVEVDERFAGEAFLPTSRRVPRAQQHPTRRCCHGMPSLYTPFAARPPLQLY